MLERGWKLDSLVDKTSDQYFWLDLTMASQR